MKTNKYIINYVGSRRPKVETVSALSRFDMLAHYVNYSAIECVSENIILAYDYENELCAVLHSVEIEAYAFIYDPDTQEYLSSISALGLKEPNKMFFKFMPDAIKAIDFSETPALATELLKLSALQGCKLVIYGEKEGII